MGFETSSPTHDYDAAISKEDELAPQSQLNDTSIRQESSDGDMPIMARRQLRESITEDDDDFIVGEHRTVRDSGREEGHVITAHKCLTVQKAVKAPPKKTEKGHKKPGPVPWASKPIMKNDMKAKNAVIREIEGYWGKGFIRSYIPKCHSPLVKRGKHGKRAMYRDHETDPKKWLPSVLKAVLMIAKLTNNKKWLKDAMNDVVRYRIKQTGNRKPQLVTTDFDVIEDMLVKDWDVAYAFEIRYKHLLVNRKDQEETDEDIDHILQVASDPEDDMDDAEEESDDSEDIVDQELDDGNENDDENFGLDHRGISSKYLHSGGYTQASQHPLPATPKQQQTKRQKTPKQPRVKSEQPSPPPPDSRQQQQQQTMYGFDAPTGGYNGPPIYPWGHMMHLPGGPNVYNNYSSYGGYGAYGGYPGYGLSQYPGRNSRQGSQQPPPHGMFLRHPMSPAPSNPDPDRTNRRPSPFDKKDLAHDGYEQTRVFGTGHPDLPIQGYPNAYQSSLRPNIKRESPTQDEHVMSIEDLDGLANNLGELDDDNSEDVDAELEAAELELKLARLRAKKAAKKRSK